VKVMPSRLPTFYLSHGGGPWPYMTGQHRRVHQKLEASLKDLPGQIGVKPKAILMVSGHWEERDFAVTSNAHPPMVYDFGGFPREMYEIRYSAPGSPELAEHVHSLIQQAGLATHLDPQRGFDHGTYSILAVTYPEADIPVIQVSIRADYDPEAHLKLGRAIAPLGDEGVLVIGSGSSYHDLQAFFYPNAKKNPKEDSARFDSWLKQTLVDSTPEERSKRLLEWENAPSARAAQPQEDHLIPLHVAVGAAEDEPGAVIYQQNDFFGQISMSSYRFGEYPRRS